MNIEVDDRSHATILAALRYWQRAIEDGLRPEFMPHFEDEKPLSADEIDELCFNLNVTLLPTLRVLLRHDPNPDLDYRGGYWSLPVEDGSPKWVQVASMADASKVCRQYIERHQIGAGNWTGGAVINEHDDPVARVSFNGRVWVYCDLHNCEVEHLESPGRGT